MTAFTMPVWSFSLLEMFENCPKQAFHKYVLKEKYPQTEQQAAGSAVDKALEERIKKGTPLPQEFATHEPLMQSLCKMREDDCQLYTQLKLGIKRDFTPCQFFDKDVWGRSVLDFLAVKRRSAGNSNGAFLVDFKNGKNNESKPFYDGGLQRKIFTLMTWKMFPGLDRVTSVNLYLQQGKMGKPLVFTRADEPAMWREVLPKVLAVEKAFKEQRWPVTPSPLCAWCPVTACEFNKR